MREQVLDKEAMERLAADRPVTITLHLSSAEVEMALTTGGLSLCRPAMRALVLARVLDVTDLDRAA
jgi:hypothetical protein